MKDLLAQHGGLAAALVGLVVLSVFVLLLTLVRRRARKPPRAPEPAPAQQQRIKADPAVLRAALNEAEAAGQRDWLPGLYLALADCHLEAGQDTQAADLLLKCLRGGAPARHKATHARARLALGDLAQAAGDPTTACEHWQIARALFYELKQADDHQAAEQRMLRNGCPTDWVLTDF
jgi:tetratricopeptide (TPR) repeat protein